MNSRVELSIIFILQRLALDIIEFNAINRNLVIKEPNHRKDHILDIAEKVFANLGFEGASIRVIANEAGVNSAMLSYYFGSKDGLFLAVFERKIDGLQFLLQVIAQNTKLSSWQKLEMCVDYYIDRFLVNDDFQKLIHREVSFNNRSVLAKRISQILMTNVSEFKVILNEGVSDGSFDPGADIQLLTTMIVGTKNYIINTPGFCALLIDHDVMDNAFLENELKPRFKIFLKKILSDHLLLTPKRRNEN